MFEKLNPWLAARWRGYMNWIGGGLLLAGLFALSAAITLKWWLLPLASASLLATALFYAVSTWQMRNLLDGRASAETVWRILSLDTGLRYVCVESGLRATGLHLSRKLQRGTLKIVDIYNPQQMTDRYPGRLREVAREEINHEPSDPRALWIEGSIDHLPQRDNSVPAVVFDQVLSALTQRGDHARLLREAYRILKPGGQLIVIEAMRGGNLMAVFGNWISAETLNQLLTSGHFLLHDDHKINDLLHAVVALKPIPRAEQLTFNF